MEGLRAVLVIALDAGSVPDLAEYAEEILSFLDELVEVIHLLTTNSASGTPLTPPYLFLL